MLGINEPAVTIKNIENAIIDYAWNHGLMSADLPQDYTGKQIAVVGSGPAGLACAAQLNKVSLSVSLSVCLSLSLCLSVSLSVSLSVCLSLSVSVLTRDCTIVKGHSVSVSVTLMIHA